MLSGMEALEVLATDADTEEQGQSAYWRDQVGRFSVSADGTVAGETVLGSVSHKIGWLHTSAHWLLQAPFRVMAREYKAFGEIKKLGRLIARRQGRQFTHDMLRQVLSLALIRRHVSLEGGDKCNLVIGDGYGVMTSLLLLAGPHRKTILVNLTKPLLLDLAHVQKAVPGLGFILARNGEEMRQGLADPGVRLIAVRADDGAAITEAPIGLAINIVSMQEMEMPVIAEYFRILRTNKSDDVVFYCANKLWKKLIDGTEIRFLDYPWDDSDEVLHDCPCPWSQWVYSKIPPFWHYRRGDRRVIWHRLARLKVSS